MEHTDWTALTPREKKVRLFQNQKALLDQFLASGAITNAQYAKSLGDLREKMGIDDSETVCVNP